MATQYLVTLLGAVPFFVVWTLLDALRLRAMRAVSLARANEGEPECEPANSE